MQIHSYTSNDKNQAGKIRVSATQRGKTLQAKNFTQNQWKPIGSISGRVYEKVANILKVVKGEYCPSFTLTAEELQTARDLGATFMRIINGGVTYAISLNDFEKNAQPYTNAYYGEQLACAVEHFAKTGQSRKRNLVVDSPPIESQGYERPQAKQLPMFDLGIRRGPGGEVWGGSR